MEATSACKGPLIMGDRESVAVRVVLLLARFQDHASTSAVMHKIECVMHLVQRHRPHCGRRDSRV